MPISGLALTTGDAVTASGLLDAAPAALDPASVLPRHYDSQCEKALTRSSAWRGVTRRENERSRAAAKSSKIID